MATMHATYRSWNTQQLIDWILSIDTSFESKYKQTLTNTMNEQGVTGKDIDGLDLTDLKVYGIINLMDRKQIYGEIRKLIVHRKRSDSLQLEATHNTEHANFDQVMDHEEDIKSLSDDEEEDKLTNLTNQQWNQLKMDGYCMVDDPLKDELARNTVHGYIRQNFSEKCLIPGLIRTIINFYNVRYNTDLYVELFCEDLDDDDNDTKDHEYFLVPKVNITLSNLMVTRMEAVGNRIGIDIKKVTVKNLHHVLRYLGHHKGVTPETIAKPIRSVKMERIVADKWDADYINAMSKKVIFQVILAANYLDCPPLLHLGAAKIATLIKGKSPEEIRQILADDGKDDDDDQDDTKDDEKEDVTDDHDNDQTVGDQDQDLNPSNKDNSKSMNDGDGDKNDDDPTNVD